MSLRYEDRRALGNSWHRIRTNAWHTACRNSVKIPAWVEHSRGRGRNGQEGKLDMAHLISFQIEQSIQHHPSRSAALWVVALLFSALLAGCATKALHPATGIGDKSSAKVGAGGAGAGRDSPMSSQGGKGASGATRTDGSSGSNGAGGTSAAGAGAGGASDGGAGVSASSLGDESGGGGAGGNSANGAGGNAANGAGGNSANGAGGGGAGAGGANARGADGKGGTDGSTTGDASNGGGRGRNGAAGGAGGANSANGGGAGGGGPGGRGAGGQGADSNGAGGQNAPGAGGAGAGAGGAGAGSESSSAAGAGGNNAGGANAANGGAGGGNAGGAEGRDGTGAGVGVGAGEGDGDNRIAAIEVPNKNVKVDEEFKPQTLGGMLPLVLGVNEEGRFDFDQYALREEVKGVLDELSDKLRGAEFDRLDIIGYTDRIGTRDYNKRLSELRAWSVAQYLIQKGVPENKVFYEGRGDKDPVTRNDECTGLGRAELITCLQKDWRVEIEASIRRKHATVTQ
jgi:outer membrane protein OmpA-like peptidoglycan-associated protein